MDVWGSLTNEVNNNLVIDSSGFELIIGSFWRLAKWGKKTILKTSNIFCKAHIAVALPSRAIVSIETSESTTNDSVVFGPILKNMYTWVIQGI